MTFRLTWCDRVLPGRSLGIRATTCRKRLKREPRIAAFGRLTRRQRGITGRHDGPSMTRPHLKAARSKGTSTATGSGYTTCPGAAIMRRSRWTSRRASIGFARRARPRRQAGVPPDESWGPPWDWKAWFRDAVIQRIALAHVLAGSRRRQQGPLAALRAAMRS